MLKHSQNLFLISIIVISIILAFLRIHGIRSEIFQALAHLWVGGLLATWITLKIINIPQYDDMRELSGFSTLTLSLIELACFIFLK